MLTVGAGTLVFFAVALGVIGLGRYLDGRAPRDQRAAVRRLRALGGTAADLAIPAADAGWFTEAAARSGEWEAPDPETRGADLRARLALAGVHHPSAVLYFNILRLALVVLLALACGGLAVAAGARWKPALLWTVAGGGAGLLLPAVALSSRVAKRQQGIRHALPDVLDIMVLSVEGGASLSAAISYATEEIQTVHTLLGQEMLIVQREMQLGTSAGDAFRSFADRCGLTEARDLAAALVQSERYGASVAKALRAYSEAARQDRQLWAEEVAQKAAVKIVFPMLLCIFPAIFIVLLGPAAMQMSKLFSR